MKRYPIAFLFLLVASLAACANIETDEVNAPRQPAAAAGLGGGENGAITFSETVQPILIEFCGECHNASSQTAGIDLTSYESIMAVDGLVVPGAPEDSLLIQVLDGGIMPPVGKRRPTPEMIDMIAAWIADGALDN
ncbi:MAG: hypothetical protein D6795_12565 [Deltaproteobacteria bacterium]|nr:MAG: hypothetical protein D6795_12565 [Deltaproteobacteria bacterium]